MASQYAIKSKIKCPQEWKDRGVAGQDWYEGFMERHPWLPIRTPCEGCEGPFHLKVTVSEPYYICDGCSDGVDLSDE